MPIDAIRGLIEQIVRKRFQARIASVRVERDTDHDGDEVFRVTVIFDGNAPLDAHETVGIVRHTRKELLERNDPTFPIFAFVSKMDADRQTAAA